MRDDDLDDVHVLLDDVPGGASRLFGAARRIVRVDNADGGLAAVEAAFAAVEKGLDEGLWAAGFLSYELGYLFEPRLSALRARLSALPLLWFGLFDAPRALAADETEAWLSENDAAYETVRPPRASLSKAAYRERFAVAKRMIETGDIYQINLTFRADFEIAGDPAALYRALRKAQPVSHGAFIETRDFSVLSLSPELFLKRKGKRIETRPMKGTEPRGTTPADDETARDRLRLDEKQRAENLMIVDLMRNDIGRIAKTGSVKVPDLFSVETYPTLFQMTSGVEGELRDGVGLPEIVASLFPAGSITGAPKIRAMELIHALEPEARGVYCGSIGYIAPDRDMDFNVAIRTAAVLAGGRGEIGIGSGVVADSEADKEYAEAVLKMRFLSDAMDDFQLFETMLHEAPAGIWLLDRHMERLAGSAAHFDFPFDRDEALKLLHAQTLDGGSARLRVRLALRRDGTLSVTKAALPGKPGDAPGAVSYVLSPTRLDSADPFLRHKTTRRALYDREFEHYSAARNAGEVVYLNERGELAEGSRTNIFLEMDSVLLTPPLSSGLLPGTLRAHLLESGRAREAVLTLGELREADAVYLGNSVRGLQPASPIDEA